MGMSCSTVVFVETLFPSFRMSGTTTQLKGKFIHMLCSFTWPTQFMLSSPGPIVYMLASPFCDKVMSMT